MNLPICLSHCVTSFTDSSSESSLGSKRRICSISIRVLLTLHWSAMSRLHATMLFGNLFVVNAFELEGLFGVELLGRGGTQSIPRTAHCMFDLGNLRFLNCIYPRVRHEFSRRGSAVPSRYLLSGAQNA